jgi:hypothetical protein
MSDKKPIDPRLTELHDSHMSFRSAINRHYQVVGEGIDKAIQALIETKHSVDAITTLLAGTDTLIKDAKEDSNE